MNEKEKIIEQQIADGIAKGLEQVKEQEKKLQKAKIGNGLFAIGVIFLTFVTVGMIKGTLVIYFGQSEGANYMGNLVFWSTVVVLNFYMWIFTKNERALAKEVGRETSYYSSMTISFFTSFIFAYFMEMVFDK